MIGNMVVDMGINTIGMWKMGGVHLSFSDGMLPKFPWHHLGQVMEMWWFSSNFGSQTYDFCTERVGINMNSRK